LNEIDLEFLLQRKLYSKKIMSYDNKVEVPVFSSDGFQDFASITGNRLTINVDIISLSFIMLSRYEEKAVLERDQYCRFEFKNSLAYHYDYIDIPIVDEYSFILRKWIKEFIPTIRINKRKSKLIPSHDIDQIKRFGGFFRNIETIIGGDIINRRSLSIAFKSLRQLYKTSKNPYNDPFVFSIATLIAISKKLDLISEFYFKGLHTGDYDSTYDISSTEIHYCMNLIKEAGMVVGIHGGLNSFNDVFIFEREKQNLEKVYGNCITRGRQHYLKFDINSTINVWQKSGIKSDTTLGYAEREGFRCGTCHEYFLYDFAADNTSSVLERPLIVMEVTLFGYRNLSIESSYSAAEKLYKRCHAVEGDFVLLWHNYNLFREYETRFKEVYCKFLEKTR
jgi:hypothetical protein